MWEQCVIDATMGARNGVFTFCPIEGDIEGDFQVVTGMNFLGMPPKGMKMVAIVHADGQEGVDAFCEAHKRELDALADSLKKYDPETYGGLVHELAPVNAPEAGRGDNNRT